MDYIAIPKATGQDMKKSVITMLHIGYWVLYVLFLTLLAFLTDSRSPSLLGWGMIKFITAVAVIPGVASFYVSYTFLFPEFLHKKRIPFLLAAAIAVACITSLIGIITLPFLYGSRADPTGPIIMLGDGFYTKPGDMGKTFLIPLNAIVCCVVGLVMKVFISWYADIKLKEDLNRKNFETELAMVKSQLNPHFLFNTINNIDVLIEKDAVQASAYLNKLSDIMRFMLYETKSEMIGLAKELTYIEKYIDLQKIRTANKNYISYAVYGNVEGRTIAPMLFIPFIENAFKHAEDKKKDNAINISIHIEEKELIFDCINKYAGGVLPNPEQGGLGNDLIRRRLELLYPGRHTLTVNDHDATYSVKLTIADHEN